MPASPGDELGQGRGRPADEGGPNRTRSAAPVAVGSEARDRPALGDGDEQGAPGAVAVAGRPQRPPGQRERVALGRPVVQLEAGDGEDVRRAGIEDEGILEDDPRHGPTLGAEPAGGRQVPAVETGKGGLDRPPGELAGDRLRVRGRTTSRN